MIIKNKNIILSFGALLVILFSVFIFFRYSKPVINIVYSDSIIMEKNIKAVVNLMKKDKIIEEKIHKDIDFYIFNFANSTPPKIKNISNLNILWLGSTSYIDVNKIKKFDYIFVSTHDLYYFLINHFNNVYYIPIFTITNNLNKQPCSQQTDNNRCYWIVFGDNYDVISYFNDNNIKYKHFNIANEKITLNIIKDLSNISGIATSNVFFDFNSLDISPLFFIAASSNIPIIEHKEINQFSLLNLFFNNSINIYSSYDDIDFIFKNNINTQNTKIIVDNFFSQTSTKDRIISILTQRTYKAPIINEMIDVWCASLPSEFSNGDFAFSFDLIQNIKANYKSISNPSSIIQHIGKINIYIRGMIDFFDKDINKDSISIIYLLYPAVKNFNDKDFSISVDEYILSIIEELKLFDGIIVASNFVHNALKKHGIHSYYVPQFTNTNKFYFDPDDNLKSDVLFVGSKYFDRLSVPILLENNINVDVYGPNWNGIEKSSGIDNRILRKYYSSAKIVLNDTRPDMKQLNFISNRIFDASACGTLVISDYIKEIEDIYGDSIPMWKTKEELVELVKYYLDPKNEDERLNKAKRAQEITLKNFTSDIAGQKFEEIITEVKKNKSL